MSVYDQARERVASQFLCRTPIEPVARIVCPGLQKGNADLVPATRNPPTWVKPIIGDAK